MKKLWQKIKDKLNAGWKIVNGKKMWIGLGMHTVWFVANLAVKDLASTTEVGIGHALIGSWTGVGVGHKIVKNKDKISKVVNNLKK